MIDIREALTRKLGPLPVWAWGGVVGGAILVARVARGGGGGGQGTFQVVSGEGASFDAADVPSGGSGGSGGAGGILDGSPSAAPQDGDSTGGSSTGSPVTVFGLTLPSQRAVLDAAAAVQQGMTPVTPTATVDVRSYDWNAVGLSPEAIKLYLSGQGTLPTHPTIDDSTLVPSR